MNFLSPARWRLICPVLLVVGLLCSITSGVMDSRKFETAAAVLLALSMGGTFAFWRCPHCRTILPLKNMMHITHCPKCRSDVRDFY